ncbi:MAG: hypothetical protein WBD95_08170 [Xanthobacteraceae bacterium]
MADVGKPYSAHVIVLGNERPNTSHVTARDEVKRLIDSLRLPIDERGKRRAAARAEWAAAATRLLDTHDLFG